LKEYKTETVSELWGFSLDGAKEGKDVGAINEWEAIFIENNMHRTSFTEKQQPIADRIKAKMGRGAQQEGACGEVKRLRRVFCSFTFQKSQTNQTG